MAIRHIVLFRFYDAIDEDSRRNAVEQIRSMETSPGILEWRIEVSMDTRKGVVVAQNVLFKDQDAFDAYRSSTDHKQVGEILSSLADWQIADYVE